MSPVKIEFVAPPLPEISDLDFLRTILEDLDESWTTFTMCTRSGKKCLVGAGAAALGVDYALGWKLFFDDTATPLENWREAKESYIAHAQRIQNIAAKRVGELLDIKPQPMITGNHSYMSAVTTFNDVAEDYQHSIRPHIVAAINKLVAENRTNRPRKREETE